MRTSDKVMKARLPTISDAVVGGLRATGDAERLPMPPKLTEEIRRIAEAAGLTFRCGPA